MISFEAERFRIIEEPFKEEVEEGGFTVHKSSQSSIETLNKGFFLSQRIIFVPNGTEGFFSEM